MTYYEHNGKRYTLDDLCKDKIVIVIRRTTLLSGDTVYFADINELEGWQIPAIEARRVVELYGVPLELH